jgi:uncharacterized protein YdcH (DUF465 family)
MDIPHELRDEFPQEISLIERMIRTNYEFRRLAERYDEVNRNIYRIVRQVAQNSACTLLRTASRATTWIAFAIMLTPRPSAAFSGEELAGLQGRPACWSTGCSISEIP